MVWLSPKFVTLGSVLACLYWQTLPSGSREHSLTIASCSSLTFVPNSNIITHAETQECFEWDPTLTGNNAWNTDIVKVEKYVLRELADPVKTIQGPASIKSMGIIYMNITLFPKKSTTNIFPSRKTNI